jgi:hypothetical protein
MKTITLDYTTYRMELEQAKADGAKLYPHLKDKIQHLMYSLDKDRISYENAKRDLWNLLVEIDNIDKYTK